MPGMLSAAILQSPLAHAKILHIDVSKARKLPGVKAVVTAKEAGLVKYGVSRPAMTKPSSLMTRCVTLVTKLLRLPQWIRRPPRSLGPHQSGL